MKKRYIVACLLASVSANAQPVPQQQPEFTLKVTADEINLVSEGLGSLPFNKVVALLNKLRNQVMVQQQPPKPVDNPEQEKK